MGNTSAGTAAACSQRRITSDQYPHCSIVTTRQTTYFYTTLTHTFTFFPRSFLLPYRLTPGIYPLLPLLTLNLLPVVPAHHCYDWLQNNQHQTHDQHAC